MNKGLEELNNPLAISIPVSDTYMEYTYTSKQRDVIEKELKAIEIIKEMKCFHFYEIEGQYYVSGISISKEKYDLLNEVLL